LGKTSAFLFLTLTVTIFVFGSILWNRSVRNSQILAWIFYIAAAVPSLGSLLCILLYASRMPPESTEFDWLLRILIYRCWLVIGTGISSVFLILLNMGTGAR
jgi:hypothetical protein